MEREYPDQGYYPSCKVRLIVRFEDFGRTDPPAPATRAPARDGQGRAPEDADPPQQQESSSDGQTHVVYGIVPAVATVGRNGVRAADTLSVELKYADLPIDPRTVRACAVELYMGTVTPEDHDRGVRGEVRVTSDPGSAVEVIEPAHMVPDSFVDDAGQQRSNLRFQGWVDKWEVVWNDKAPRVSLECTDNTRLLIDQPAPPRLTISPSKPVDEAMADYLAEFPQFEGLGVRYLPAGEAAPQLEGVLQITSRVGRKGPAPGGGSGAEVSVWDYFTDVAGMLGHTVRMVGTDVVVQRVRQLLRDAGAEGRVDDPFVAQGGRTLPDGTTLQRRLMVYGRNVRELRIAREFSRHAATNVEVRCYQPRRKNTLVGRHPPLRSRQARRNVGDASDQKWFVYRVQGIRDRDTLARVAQEIYEQIGRRELEVEVETRNLASYGGGNSDPDLLDLEPGDPVDVELQRESADSQSITVAELEDTLALEAKASRFLQDLGFDADFAQAYARAFVDVGLVSTFHVSEVGLDWNEMEGITVELGLVNYVLIRADQPTEEEGST